MHRKRIESVPKEAQTLNLLDKDFKSATLKVLKYLNEIMSKKTKGSMKIMLHQRENISKKIEITF